MYTYTPYSYLKLHVYTRLQLAHKSCNTTGCCRAAHKFLHETVMNTLCAAPRCCASFLVPLQTPVVESSAKRTWPSLAQLTICESPV